MALSREGILSPVFSNIEEYVGRNSQKYYDALAQVGQGNGIQKTTRYRGFVFA